EGFDGHAVADPQIRDPIAHGGDRSRELMAHDDRQLRAGQRMGIGRYHERTHLVLVKVRTTESVVSRSERDLSGTRFGDRQLLDSYVSRSVEDSCEHHAIGEWSNCATTIDPV